jgi:hypothetical protein
MELIYVVSGIKVVYRNTTPIESEVSRLNVESSGATGRFVYKNKEIELPGSELTEFKKYRGQYINDKLTLLLESTRYKNASDEKKKQLIKNVYTKASEYAKKL